MTARSRLTILPDSRLAALAPVVEERLKAVLASVTPENLGSLLDPLLRRVLDDGFRQAGAHEGTLWLEDGARKNLVPAYNTGPNAEKIVGTFKQPLEAGLISMVYSSEQPFVENEVYKNSKQSKLLDSLLKAQTYAMVAVPFYLLGGCRGVLSCVQLKVPNKRGPDPAGFEPDHLESITHAGSVVSRMLDARLTQLALGMER